MTAAPSPATTKSQLRTHNARHRYQLWPLCATRFRLLKPPKTARNPKECPLDFAYSSTVAPLMNKFFLDNFAPLLFPVLVSVCTICCLLLWGWPKATCNSLVVTCIAPKPGNSHKFAYSCWVLRSKEFLGNVQYSPALAPFFISCCDVADRSLQRQQDTILNSHSSARPPDDPVQSSLMSGPA